MIISLSFPYTASIRKCSLGEEERLVCNCNKCFFKRAPFNSSIPVISLLALMAMSAKYLNILIADDDDEDLELIEEAIRSVAPTAVVHMVKDGKAVLKFLDSQNGESLPGLVILDYNMPELNGAEVLSLIAQRGLYGAIPKVILSTSSAPLYIQECKKNGAAGFFTKPNTKVEFDLLVSRILALATLA